MRFMRELKEKEKHNKMTSLSSKRKRFNLLDEEDEDDNILFTHRGKTLTRIDDFKEAIP